MKKLVLVLSSFLLFSCAHTYWQNSNSNYNNEAIFSQDRAECQLLASSATREVQAIQANTNYGNMNKTGAALTGTANGLQQVATNIGTFENCMMSKGWYKTQKQDTVQPSGQTSGQFHEIERTDNNIKRYRLGIDSKDTPDGKLMVNTVMPKMPADKAGVKAGDIILSFDGKKLTQKELVPFMNSKQKGEHVILVVERNNKIINVDIEPTEVSSSPVGDKIGELLRDKRIVAMAIIVGQVKNAMPNNNAQALEAWESAMRSNLQSQTENNFLTMKNNTPKDLSNNFSIVDTSRLESILNEYPLSQSGHVSDNLSAKIRDIAGATHLLLIEFSRFPSSDSRGYSDITNYRLIDIGTGEVLAISTFRITMGV